MISSKAYSRHCASSGKANDIVDQYRAVLPQLVPVADRIAKDFSNDGTICIEGTDLIAELYGKLTRSRAPLIKNRDPGDYFSVALRNIANDKYRKASKEAFRVEKGLENLGSRRGCPGDSDTPYSRLVRKESRRDLLQTLGRALSHLSFKERKAFLLFLKGRTYREIGAILGVGQKTVDANLSRARKKLRAALLRKGRF